MGDVTGKRRIDRITADAYLDGLHDKDLEAVRLMRDECREEEAILSFERRLLQGRMDILRAELARRSGGSEATLVELLPGILTADRPAPGRGALPAKEPSIDFDQSRRRVERLISDDTLANLESLSAEDIERIVGSLVETEREISDGRREVQRVLDAISAEIARRYKSGEADPADLLIR